MSMARILPTRLSGLDPETTLIIVASKTFTTIETMTNAATAREFIVSSWAKPLLPCISRRSPPRSTRWPSFGIERDRVFGFWDWVGRRYSLWSAIGLPLMIAIGKKPLADFLAGARAMDEHFRAAPVEREPADAAGSAWRLAPA
jgi:glucose-6-phosphate isomerase